MTIALRTWSRFPIPTNAGIPPDDHPEWLARSVRYAPLVGVLVALPAAIAYAFAGLWLPHAVALLMAIAAGLLLTAAIHEREFVAACDAFESPAGDPAAQGAARRGALAIVCTLVLMLAKLETLSSIDPSWIGVSLVCAAAFSRGCAVIASAALGAAPAGPARALAGPHRLDLGVAAAWSIAPLAAATLWTGDSRVFMTASGFSVLAALLAARLLRRRPGAGPRETFGMIQQCAELAFYLGVLATLSIADETLADQAP